MKPEEFPPTFPPLAPDHIRSRSTFDFSPEDAQWPCERMRADATGPLLQTIGAEIERADDLHGHFPTIQHAAAVLRRECEEAWAEVWLKPVNRTALRMELLHVAATAARFLRLLDQDGTMPKPGPFAVAKAAKE